MATQNELRSRRIIKMTAVSSERVAALAIANGIRERRVVEVHISGTEMYGRVSRAIAIAKEFLNGDGIEVMVGSYWDDVEFDGKKCRCLCFVIEPRFDVMSRNFLGYLLPRAVRKTLARSI